MAIIVSRMVGVDTLANRPAFGTAGRLFFATDNNTLYVDTGAAWTTVLVGATTWVTTTSATTAFDALDPLTTKGDIIIHDGTNSVRRAVPTNQQIITADSTQASGWRNGYNTEAYCMFAAFQTVANWIYPIGTGDPFGGANQLNYHKLDFSRFREARATIRASGNALNTTSTDVVIYDVTNAVNITPNLNFANDGAYYTSSTAWTALNANTYAGDAQFELRIGTTGAGGESLRIGTVILELR